jgi:hypothetical protein
MTTIAFDGKTIAADTAHWKGDVISWLADKLSVLNNEDGKPVAVYATAGDYDKGLLVGELIPRILAGEKVEPLKDDECCDWEAIIITLHDLACYALNSRMILAPVGAPIAIGAGYETATAAMRCGKNAVQAVQLAADTTAYTRGPVTAYDAKKKRYTIEL